MVYNGFQEEEELECVDLSSIKEQITDGYNGKRAEAWEVPQGGGPKIYKIVLAAHARILLDPALFPSEYASHGSFGEHPQRRPNFIIAQLNVASTHERKLIERELASDYPVSQANRSKTPKRG
ncbi:hypothetical protein GOP47_0021788 [Adiantum capillus-veneris]|uniref:Uncharacterized protein n=1 Tax=Adiantum capillus-veneris TaxID=13818 RepID=A0A9D4UA79_ADICA|nr:hypothetical protein GOP47_0021788 [Adiantum capillus-veneris]